MPDLEFIRGEIEHMRLQVGRQRKEILQLQRVGIPTVSAETLLQRTLDKIDSLCAERDRLKAEQPWADQGKGSWRAPLVKWFDDDKEHLPFLETLEKVCREATREGWCYPHVQAIIVSIDQYAEAGNRDFFLNRPVSIGGSRKGDLP